MTEYYSNYQKGAIGFLCLYGCIMTVAFIVTIPNHVASAVLGYAIYRVGTLLSALAALIISRPCQKNDKILERWFIVHLILYISCLVWVFALLFFCYNDISDFLAVFIDFGCYFLTIPMYICLIISIRSKTERQPLIVTQVTFNDPVKYPKWSSTDEGSGEQWV